MGQGKRRKKVGSLATLYACLNPHSTHNVTDMGYQELGNSPGCIYFSLNN